MRIGTAFVTLEIKVSPDARYGALDQTRGVGPCHTLPGDLCRGLAKRNRRRLA
jgi:hypothetical protein